ncbi:MAG: cysteine hydrolase [Candidatus Krumholzibacteriota bacterium]|nr:cysteine hydrolase [Candidatus Krumholzibacteriota bacterium]
MKERYFTTDNIAEVSAGMLSGLPQPRGGNDRIFSPGCSALLILDMQKYFLDESSHAHIPSMEAIIPGIAALAKAFSAAGRPVILTRHLNTDNNAGMMGVWWQDIIREEDQMSLFVEGISVPGSPVIVKTQYDAFYSTKLEEILSWEGVSQLVVTGVMAHLCVESTVRSAFVRGFEVFVPVDSIATYTIELHTGSLRGLSHGFAVPVTSAMITEAFKDAR